MVRRTVEGFHRDGAGEWVAELSCLHGQHVRHRPPFQERPWVLSRAGRAERVGGELDCPRCDRAELPEGLTVVRTAGPFDDATLPDGLRRAHRVAEGTWGRLRVSHGSVRFSLEMSPPVERLAGSGDEQPIPPGVPHALSVGGPVVLAIDFLVRP